jgi:hypothetical protein
MVGWLVGRTMNRQVERDRLGGCIWRSHSTPRYRFRILLAAETKKRKQDGEGRDSPILLLLLETSRLGSTQLDLARSVDLLACLSCVLACMLAFVETGREKKGFREREKKAITWRRSGIQQNIKWYEVGGP